MNLKSSVILLSTTALLLSACSENNTKNNNNDDGGSSIDTGSADTGSATKNNKQPSVGAPQILGLAFNGFSENGTFYDSRPLNLAGDLSATEPANLYLYNQFVNAVGTKDKPSQTTAKDYTRQLPASGTNINTNDTLLDPKLAIKYNTQINFSVSPSNAVILAIPAGAPRAEAPFFPAGTKYTAVIVGYPLTATNNTAPIISIEADVQNPLKFGAFAHHKDKTFTLRAYDKNSTTDNSGSRVLLTAAKNPATIQSRFVMLTADGLANDNIELQSLKRDELSSFGFSRGKDLLKKTSYVFPKLLNSKNEPLFNDGEHGVFCLGGNNTFKIVRLADQTFLYPLSARDKTTKITELRVSDDSGFITENGKHIEIETLEGLGNLKLITVLNGAVTTADPIVHVNTLNNVRKINVVMGIVNPEFNLPADGMPLLSFDNTSIPPLVSTVDAHMAGAFYDGESELREKTVVLKSLIKKGKLSAGSTMAHSLLAHHPRTQGISSHEMNRLIATLDPMTSMHQTLGGSSAALGQHMLRLQAGSPCSANQYVASLADHVTASASNSLDHTVASLNVNSSFGGVNLVTSVYGARTSNQQDATFGSSIAASKSLDLDGATLTPSVAVGYSLDAFSDRSFSASGININLTNTALNSVFARLMTSFVHEHAGLSTTFAMGLEARHGMFSRGLASSDHHAVSLAGESTNGMYSVIEASFASNASRLNITLSNFDHAQIQFGFND